MYSTSLFVTVISRSASRCAKRLLPLLIMVVALVALVALVLAASSAFAVLPASAQPKLEIIGGRVFDWGVVRNFDQPLTTVITLKNVGTEEVVITEVRPSCGCATAPLEKSRVPVGDSTHVNVSLKMSEYNNGPQINHLDIISNAVNLPHSETLYLKAMLIRAIEPSTFTQTFPKLTVGKFGKTSITLKNTIDAPVTITGIGATHDLTTGITEAFTMQPSDVKTITVSVTPKQEQIGYLYAQVQFKTNHPQQPSFIVAFNGEVAADANADANAGANSSTEAAPSTQSTPSNAGTPKKKSGKAGKAGKKASTQTSSSSSAASATKN